MNFRAHLLTSLLFVLAALNGAQAAALPEYAKALTAPLAEPRALPITFGLENELGCRLVHLAEICTIGAISHLDPSLGLISALFFSARHRTLTTQVTSRLTKAQLERALKRVGDPNIELEFLEYTHKMGATNFRLHFLKEDFTLNFKADPNVLEVTSTPFTLDQFQKGLDAKIHFGVFEEPAKTLVRPAFFLSGGHINIGVDSTFGTPGVDFDLVAYRNFIVDFVNHSELSHGALLYDPTVVAAKPVLDDPIQRKKFRKNLSVLDSQLERAGTDAQKISSLKHDYDMIFKAYSLTKGYAINPQDHVIEIRSVRAQRNIEELRMLLELFQARVETLSRVREPIPFLDVGPIRSYGQGLAQFEDYIVGSGLDWSRFRKLLPRFWRLHEPKRELAYVHNPGKLPFLLKCQLLFLNR